MVAAVCVPSLGSVEPHPAMPGPQIIRVMVRPGSTSVTSWKTSVPVELH